MTKSNEPKQMNNLLHLVHWMRNKKGYTINAPTISWDTQKSSKWYVYYMHVVLLDTTFFSLIFYYYYYDYVILNV